MPEIPKDEVTEGKDLAAWFKMALELKALKASEMLLRKRVFGGFFPDPKEGVNKAPLKDGYVLEATYPIERKFDEAALTAMAPQFEEHKIVTDSLVKQKPSLVVSAYRLLTDEQRVVFDQALVIKPGSPTSMKVVPPKAEKEKAT